MRVRIAGQYWQLKFVRSIKNGGAACDGICDPDKKEIRVDRSLKGKDLADTIIHEVFHACGWHLHEDFVEQTASDVAEILYHPTVRGKL